LIDEKIDKKLKSSGGILLKGVRYCGKTTTAEFHAASVVRFDASEQIRQQAVLMPHIVLQGKTPRLVDEWQLAPSIWNAARYEIDKRAAKGQFILIH
jgi:predicted AAA+ superfamily ATPase